MSNNYTNSTQYLDSLPVNRLLMLTKLITTKMNGQIFPNLQSVENQVINSGYFPTLLETLNESHYRLVDINDNNNIPDLSQITDSKKLVLYRNLKQILTNQNLIFPTITDFPNFKLNFDWIFKAQTEIKSIKHIRRFSAETKLKLLESFKVSPYPSEKERLNLSKSCNLSLDQVSVWFANQRMRDKSFQEARKLELLDLA